MRLVVYSRVGKNPRQVGAGCDTRREPPVGDWAGRGASHKLLFFSYLIVAPWKAMTYTDLLGVVLYAINLSISAFNLGR